jgi:hypothetical protein
MKKRILSIFIVSLVCASLFSFAGCRTAPYIKDKTETHSGVSATITITVVNPTNDVYEVTATASAHWTYGFADSVGYGNGDSKRTIQPKETATVTITMANSKAANISGHKRFSYSVSIASVKK